MQIPKNIKPRELEETLVDGLISVAQQLAFRTLLDNTPALAPSNTPPSRPIPRRDAIAHLPEFRPLAPLTTVDQLHLRLTNGALAGMHLEAHQHAGKLRLRVRLGSAQQSALDDERLAEFKRRLSEHFGPPFQLEFFNHDAHID